MALPFFEKRKREQTQECFIKACRKGDIVSINGIINAVAPDDQHWWIDKIDEGFRWACKESQMEVVRFLLCGIRKVLRANIHSDNDFGFRIGCMLNDLTLVRYLLTSPELIEHANIHANYEEGLKYASEYGFLEIVQYLTSSPELTEHAKVAANNFKCFERAFENNKESVLLYLLSLKNEQYIPFESLKYNLNFAMKFLSHRVVYAMYDSLYHNDMLLFIERTPMVENYCNKKGVSFADWRNKIAASNIDSSTEIDIIIS